MIAEEKIAEPTLCIAGGRKDARPGRRRRIPFPRLDSSSGEFPMTNTHEGGCLCSDVRYKTLAEPLRVTICHCKFCQRFTGSAYLVEPIFKKEDVVFTRAAPRTYEHQSDSSGKRVTLNFCGRCGTTLCLDLE